MTASKGVISRIVLSQGERDALRWLLNATDSGRVISGSGDYPAHVGNLTVLLGRIRLAGVSWPQ